MEGDFRVKIIDSRINHLEFSPVHNIDQTVHVTEYHHVENHIYVNAYFHEQQSQAGEPARSNVLAPQFSHRANWPVISSPPESPRGPALLLRPKLTADVSHLDGFTALSSARSNAPIPRFPNQANQREMPQLSSISSPPGSQRVPAFPPCSRPMGTLVSRRSLPTLPPPRSVTTERPVPRLPPAREKLSAPILPSEARPQRVFPQSGFLNVQHQLQRRNCSSQKNNESTNNEAAKQRSANYSLPEVPLSRRVSNDSDLSPRLLVWDRSSKWFQVHDIVWNKWKKFTRVPENVARRQFTTVALGTSIYILLEDQTVLRLVGNQWIIKDRMKFDHGQRPPAVALNGEIYVVGSCSGKQVTSAVERFNPITNRWFPTAPMLRSKSDHAVVSTNDHVYCIGGKGCRLVEKLNPLSGRWISVAPMNTCRSCFAAAFHQNKIYAIGGDQNCVVSKSLLTEVEIYDVASNVWTNIAPLHIPRGRCKAHVIGKSLFVIGGDSTSHHGKDKTIERLELTSTTQAWTVTNLPRDMDIDAMSVTVMQVPS